MIGQTAGNYRIVQLLGQGGMGSVYLAVHPTVGRKVAVKVVHEHLARDSEIVTRFFNEGRAVNSTHHPGIVQVFDMGTLPSGAPYMVMEYLQGESLAARLLRGRLPLRDALEIARQAAAALGAVHAQGIVHRDLKPDNLYMVVDELQVGREQVKLLDFGIAKLGQASLGSASVRTRTGAVLGTPVYMSPEQCRGTREIDHRSDIYALGVILYEMVCGQPPFFSDGFGELAHLHISAPPPPPRQLVPGLPTQIEATLLRALQKEPAARFQTMAELERALVMPAPSQLEEAVTAEALPAPGVTGAGPITTLAGSAFEKKLSELRPRRRLGLVVVGAVAALAAAGLFVVLRGDLSKKPPPPAELAPEPAPTATIPAPAPPPARMIEVTISSEPSGALLVRARDGAVLGSTPFQESWRQASGVEKLRLERDGYRTETVQVPLDRGAHLTITMKKEHEPARAKPRHKPVTPSTDRKEPVPI